VIFKLYSDEGLASKRVRQPALKSFSRAVLCRYLKKTDLTLHTEKGVGKLSSTSVRWHEPKCFIAHKTEKKEEDGHMYSHQ
jgi:hypothetical protein